MTDCTALPNLYTKNVLINAPATNSTIPRLNIELSCIIAQDKKNIIKTLHGTHNMKRLPKPMNEDGAATVVMTETATKVK
jgi:hypothetical protein